MQNTHRKAELNNDINMKCIIYVIFNLVEVEVGNELSSL